MKRWVVILLVLLAVLVLISPGIMGRITERSIEDSIALAGLETREITITTERFERGWFTSAGRYRIELRDRQIFPELARFVDKVNYPGMPALIIDSRIDHGLVPVSSLSREEGSLMPGYANLVSTIQFDPGNGILVDLPGHIYSSIDLSGDTVAVLRINEGRWADGDILVGWQGADLRISLNSHGVVTSVEGFVEPLQLSADGQDVQTGRIDIAAEQSKTAYGFVVGTLLLESAGATVTSQDSPTVSYASLSVNAENNIDKDEKLRGHSTLSVTQAGVPGLGAMDFDLDLTYSGFDAASFASLYTALENAGGSGDPQSAVLALFPSMEAEMQQLFATGGEIRIDRLNITLPQGNIETDFLFSLPASADDGDFSWPGLLLKLKASMNLRLPSAVFDRVLAVQPAAGTAIAMGFLILEGDDYVMELKYAQGLATVNGFPMPIPMP